ncbi:MAG: lytic transglycosylase domain-containing protein [Candidatus Aminicenantes bacterium]|nr:lytic transglycosylase domain-containing protein [Candidatus Aminicenantes bacterium]
MKRWYALGAAALLCGLAAGPAVAAGADHPLKKAYDPLVSAAAYRHRIPVELVHSIIKVESNYNANAVSSKGATGLMQLMPDTARAYGVVDPFDPAQNIEGGVRYLKDLIKLFDRQTNKVLAAYNAGQEAIKKYGGIPPYRETRNYIQRVMAGGYNKPLITTRTPIYRYYDDSGKLVLTNDYNLYLSKKAR